VRIDPHDTQLAEALLYAQNKVKESLAEEGWRVKGESVMTKITTAEQFKQAVSVPGKLLSNHILVSNQ
jgi:hypothetical protein